MAVTKIWAVNSVANTIDYAKDEDKTKMETSIEVDNRFNSVEQVINYATNGDKTEQQFFVTGINCDSDYATKEFLTVKKFFGKTSGRQCYHGVQSFAAGEVDANTAHQIGVQLARELYGDKYQVVVTTHLNTDHIHNHFVLNSVSFVDGLKYDCKTKDYIELRTVSDKLCREYGLSVINSFRSRKLPKAIYYAEQSGLPTRRNIAKQVVDEAVRYSTSLSEFSEYLKSKGYICDLDLNHKYWTIRQRNWKRPLRLYHLGDEYTNEDLFKRIVETEGKIKVVQLNPKIKRGNFKGNFNKQIHRSRLENKYLYYCYLLGAIPKHKKKSPVNVNWKYRDDLLKLSEYSQDIMFLHNHQIHTLSELIEHKGKVYLQIEQLKNERGEAKRVLRRKTISEQMRGELENVVSGLTAEIQKMNDALKVCERIERNSEHIAEQTTPQKEINIEKERKR